MKCAANNSEQSRLPGRPRAFDRDKALHAAMLVFWRHGYDGSSLDQLTEAMDISRPSLYAAFGDKASLFREAVGIYAVMGDQEYANILALPTAREVAEAWLRLRARVNLDSRAPRGCFLVQGTSFGSAESACLRDELIAIRQEGTAKLTERFRRARADGDLPEQFEPEVLAQYLSSLAYGMSLQSTSGVTPEELSQVVELAMANWPAD